MGIGRRGADSIHRVSAEGVPGVADPAAGDIAARLVGAPHWISDGIFLLCYGAGGREPALAGLLIVIFATSGAQEANATERTRDGARVARARRR